MLCFGCFIYRNIEIHASSQAAACATMRESSSKLTQRAGYPRHRGSLSLPTGEEDERAASYASPAGKKRDQAPIRKGGRHEPWLVRAIEAASRASLYTKTTYAWLFISLLVAGLGFRGIRHGHASVWLTCTSQSCFLEITPPGPPSVTRIKILREQIIRSEAVKIDAHGNVLRVLGSALPMPHKYAGKKGKKNKRYDVAGDRGPDDDGNYDSYVLVIRENGPDVVISGDNSESGNTKRRDRHPTNSLEMLDQFVRPDEEGEYVFHMRRFNIGQSKRKAYTTVTRINSYIKNRRHKLAVRETKHVPWQAIVAIVFGVFSLILSLLCGQYFEPEGPVHRMAGTGARVQNIRTAARPLVRRPRQAPPAAAGLHGYQSSSGNGSSRNAGNNSGYGAYGGYRPPR